MTANRTARRPPARPPAERPSGSVFRNFVRALEKLESVRPAPRPSREGAR
jgi:hypothetical protein